MAYSKRDILKLIVFWCTIFAFVFFIICAIIAVAKGAWVGILITFLIALILLLTSSGVLIYWWVKRKNRQITR
ncbi:MAG: hypothetical protein HUJ42_01790 [Malacoplasma sp.]|nr:hypothetical protein [Malacoplasma sp.]